MLRNNFRELEGRVEFCQVQVDGLDLRHQTYCLHIHIGTSCRYVDLTEAELIEVRDAINDLLPSPIGG